MKVEEKLLQIINLVLDNNDLKLIQDLKLNYSLQVDLEMDSIILAELTVRIEDEFKIDIFENGMVHTIGDIITILSS